VELYVVEGGKLVDRTELEANDWSLTPGRYIGVVPEEEDEGLSTQGEANSVHTDGSTIYFSYDY
jgi:type I restriction enzyme M protein